MRRRLHLNGLNHNEKQPHSPARKPAHFGDRIQRNWICLSLPRRTACNVHLIRSERKVPVPHPENGQPLSCQQKQPQLYKQQRELLRLSAEQAAAKEKTPAVFCEKKVCDA